MPCVPQAASLCPCMPQRRSFPPCWHSTPCAELPGLIASPAPPSAQALGDGSPGCRANPASHQPPLLLATYERGRALCKPAAAMPIRPCLCVTWRRVRCARNATQTSQRSLGRALAQCMGAHTGGGPSNKNGRGGCQQIAKPAAPAYVLYIQSRDGAKCARRHGRRGVCKANP